jgi:hypothetical protein
MYLCAAPAKWLKNLHKIIFTGGFQKHCIYLFDLCSGSLSGSGYGIGSGEGTGSGSGSGIGSG